MRKVLFILVALLFVSSPCYADTIKGELEKIDIKKYEITVDGKVVEVLKATVYTENDLGVVKNIIVRDLKDHKGETAICYGFPDKENVFRAYKVRVIEGHR